MTHTPGASLPAIQDGSEAPYRGKAIVRYFGAAALFYVLAGVSAALVLSPRVPFADAWRHYTRLLTTPFPGSVLEADNGHLEVFANFIRWASLSWLQGSEGVQIVIGTLLALATLAVFLRIIWRAPNVAAPARAAAAFSLSLGVFWLGNARALLHDNEALHVYSVCLCLAGAISLMLTQRPEQTGSAARVGAAIALCFLGSLNFGSGFACFVSLLSLLFMDRAPLRSFILAAGGLLLAFACYRLLAGSMGSGVVFQPVEQVGIALRWLSVPLIYLFWPFVDQNAAASMPHPFDAMVAVARAWTYAFGDVHSSAIPQAIAGLALVLVLSLWTWQVRTRPENSNDIVKLGLALGWFGIGVSGMVALTRTRYFADFPLQLSAPRYLPWSSLAWAGLLTAFVARQPARRMRLLLAAAVGVFALAAEGGMVIVMNHQRDDADDTALAAVVGLWPTGNVPSENDPVETRASAMALREHAAGPFAWPEAPLIGKAVPADANQLAIQELRRNEAGPSGARLEVTVSGRTCDGERLLVTAHERVVGLLRHVRGDQWRGAIKSASRNDALAIFELECASAAVK